MPGSVESRRRRLGTLSAVTTGDFHGRETMCATNGRSTATWREKLFASMMRNSSSAAQYFSLPTNQIIELGAQIEM